MICLCIFVSRLGTGTSASSCCGALSSCYYVLSPDQEYFLRWEMRCLRRCDWRSDVYAFVCLFLLLLLFYEYDVPQKRQQQQMQEWCILSSPIQCRYPRCIASYADLLRASEDCVNVCVKGYLLYPIALSLSLWSSDRHIDLCWIPISVRKG